MQLACDPENTPDACNYEVHIGKYSNTVCEILKDGAVVASYKYGGMTSTDILYNYWINWYKGKITLGLGSYNSGELTFYYDSAPYTITAVTIKSLFPNGVTEWQFPNNVGKLLYLQCNFQANTLKP